MRKKEEKKRRKREWKKRKREGKKLLVTDPKGKEKHKKE